MQVHIDDVGAFNSEVLRVRISYVDGAPVMRHVVLKSPTQEEWSQRAAVDEAEFYALVEELGNHPQVIPTCLAASSAVDDSYVVLVDLTASHVPPLSRDQIVGGDSVPTQKHLDQVVRALARLHAYWWEHQSLGRLFAPYWSEAGEGFHHYRDRRQAAWQYVLEQAADVLPPAAQVIYPQVFEGSDRHWENWLGPRVGSSRQLTVVHGDAYFSNFLCPRPGREGSAVLVDWQSASAGIGAADLVNLCATFWTRRLRLENDLEQYVLTSYHEQLCSAGIRDYPFEDLCLDYRLGLMYWLLMPLQDARDGSPVDYWRPKMQCLLEAFKDWGCGQLLA